MKPRNSKPTEAGKMDSSKVKSLVARKTALMRGERTAGRVFELKRNPDGSIERVSLDPESHRLKIASDWNAKAEVIRARQNLNLTQQGFAGLLGIGLSTLRSWEQGKREPSGAARVLISIAIDHPEILQEASRKSA